jgi:hypothetical protein
MIEIKENKFYIKSVNTGEATFNKSFDTFGAATSFIKKQVLSEFFEVDFNHPSQRIRRMLTEGLGQGDLIDLLMPRISFDEYVSNNDNNNIVLAFFVLNEPLAVEPLEKFCSKIPGVVDVDSSDSDTISNASIVYVEFKREDDSKEQIKGLIEDISKVSNIPLEDFGVSFPSREERFPYSEELIDLYFMKMV